MLAGEIELYSKIRIKGIAYYPTKIERANRNIILTCRRIYGKELNKLRDENTILYLRLTEKVEVI